MMKYVKDESVSMASIDNKDFLRFSAYSFKDMITRKLSENSRFTDQIYEGSNITILIDLCAYLFQGLTFCLNNAAAESMFADTQIYSNINRIVKLIGYNPKGFVPSSAVFEFESAREDDDIVIQKYTALDTNRVDTRGNKIYYSFVDDYSLVSGKNSATLYNGVWKLYSQVFTAAGTTYETFTLNGLQSTSGNLDSTKDRFVAHNFIHVYVKRKDKFIQFKTLTDEIFMNIGTKYDGGDDAISIFKNTDDDRYCSIRLNERKTYEIKFGNDFNGQKLEAGDKVYIIYLDSNGFDANLAIGDVSDAKFTLPEQILGMKDAMFYENICEIRDEEVRDRIKETVQKISGVMNTSASTRAIAEESVEEIRDTAPNYYKIGNRLVTKDDYEYYVKNRFKGNIIDVKCQNNWDYLSTFFGWLYNLGKTGVWTDKEYNTRKPDPRYYINEARLLKYDYKFADPADENNVYLWVKMQNDMNIWKQIDEDLIPLKVLTSETVCVDPITVNFAICAAPEQRALEYFKDQTFDAKNESYLEITINDNSLYTNSAIKAQINEIFMEYFNENNLQLGQVVDMNDVESKIYAISGVQRIRTVFSSSDKKKYLDRFVDGISFAAWSATLIDRGDDLTIGTGNRSLEVFQFPKLYHSSIVDKIIVIKRSFSNNSSIVQY